MKIINLFLLLTFTVVAIRCSSEASLPKLPDFPIHSSYLVSTEPAELDSVQQKTVQEIDHFFNKKYKYYSFNGAVLMAEKGKVVYKKALGMGDFRKKDTLSTTSAFQLASVSKPLTAYAVMLLYQRGQLSLTDSMQKFFPDFPYSGITVKMLLSHRSGLPNYMYFSDSLWIDRYTPITNTNVLELITKYKPNHYYIPNHRYNYCNTNYSLLASIIEKVSGKSFKGFMKDEIFTPLGMYNAFVYEKTARKRTRFPVMGYTKRGRFAEDSYLNGVVGDKGIYASVEDLFKWDQAMYKGYLVNKKTLAEGFTPQHRDLRKWDNYGFGWRLDYRDENDRVIYHSGWWKGFRTYFIRKIDQQKTIIALTNHEGRNYLSNTMLRRIF